MGITKIQKSSKSFTLIEMIITIGTIGLVLPALFVIIFSILQQQLKIQRLSIAKREGDYVLNIIENTIRNYAESVHSTIPANENNKICLSNNIESVNYFKDKFGNWFRFCSSSDGQNCDNADNFIASSSSTLGNAVSLNSNQTKITDLTIQCYRTTLYSPPVINVSFKIQYDTTFLRADEITTPLNYQTKIKLRSY